MDDLFPVVAVEQPRSVALQGRQVPFLLKRSQRRQRIAFLVDDHGLSVHAPWRAPDQAVEQAIHDAALWILHKLDEWSSHSPSRSRSWSTGDALEYLGRPLSLSVGHDAHITLTQLEAEAGVLSVRLPQPDDRAAVRTAVVKWYRRHAEHHFPERIDHFAGLLGVDKPKVFLTDASTRWGSCNVKREVRLNWRLMQAPTHLVDYVVAHELAHLVHLDHSRRFWRAVGRLYPAYQAARTELSAMSRHFMSL